MKKILQISLDKNKEKEILGYKEEVDFDEGLKITVDWFKEKCV